MATTKQQQTGNTKNNKTGDDKFIVLDWLAVFLEASPQLFSLGDDVKQQ